MTENKVCKYCKKEHSADHETVCPFYSVGLYSKPKKVYYALDIEINPIKEKAKPFIQPNPEAVAYFHSIWGFGGTQEKW